MLRSLLRVCAAGALALLLSPAMPSAAPAPGISFDEIAHVSVDGSPPSELGFQTAYDELHDQTNTAPAATSIYMAGGGRGNLGARAPNQAAIEANRAAAAAPVTAAIQALSGKFNAIGAAIRIYSVRPHVLHVSIYNDAQRIDDLTTNVTTIRKCDIGQVYRLNNNDKTYQQFTAAAEPPPMPAGGPPPPADPSGTATADITTTVKALGPLPIDGTSRDGYGVDAKVTIGAASGGCAAGTATIARETYFSALPVPVTSCPLRNAVVPESVADVVTPPQSGCKIVATTHDSGPALPQNIPLYSLVTINDSLSFSMQRGNFKPIGDADVALFAIPAGYVKH